MKKKVRNKMFSVQPIPKLLVSCRDRNGKDNALAVGFAANVCMDPPMIMVGIHPNRYSHHMMKDTGCFIVNLVSKDYKDTYDYLGSHSAANEDKMKAMKVKTENGKVVNAPILSDCPVSIECSIIESSMPGTHELFIGKVENVSADEQYLDRNGNIDWSKIDLL